ncbi:MgtC/SapB family protein [Marinicella gelatinilytica]|uniref:MgtC/SapB family protein n=1 Tax=Marinicella gelatinilytica TaxID=2996017 RepID=UPI002260E09D|nr:MgtC/SapB family protein [Marinicella gelatinilytica]MCX7545322.1 MgtC/SapB family protein [Marinicella gelatinilytica]
MLKNFGLVFVALIISLPIAYNREQGSKSAGLRTYPLVSVATCSYTLLALQVLDGSDALGKYMAGIITGIGFIGGGAILKGKDNAEVNGLATAASIWNTGAIGMSVAWQKFEIAIMIALINFIILSIGRKAKDAICDDD